MKPAAALTPTNLDDRVLEVGESIVSNSLFPLILAALMASSAKTSGSVGSQAAAAAAFHDEFQKVRESLAA